MSILERRDSESCLFQDGLKSQYTLQLRATPSQKQALHTYLSKIALDFNFLVLPNIHINSPSVMRPSRGQFLKEMIRQRQRLAPYQFKKEVLQLIGQHSHQIQEQSQELNNTFQRELSQSNQVQSNIKSVPQTEATTEQGFRRSLNCIQFLKACVLNFIRDNVKTHFQPHQNSQIQQQLYQMLRSLCDQFSQGRRRELDREFKLQREKQVLAKEVSFLKSLLQEK